MGDSSVTTDNTSNPQEVASPCNQLNMSDAENNLLEDLEEGEIKDEAFEDISECSLSEILIMQDDLKDDSDVDHLREEALKSLHENDEITEEELYRLEALKSLLTNIESHEQKSTKKVIGKRKRKRKKKVKQKLSPKHFKTESNASKNLELPIESVVQHITDQHSPVSPLIISPRDVNKENLLTDDIKLATRLWYPRSDSALLNPCIVQSSNREEQPTEVQKRNDDFILVPKVLSIANVDIKPVTASPKKQNYRFQKINQNNECAVSVAAPVSKQNRPQSVLSMNFSRYKKISQNYVPKYDSVTPIVNRFSLRNIKKGKYKLVNSSRYVLKKTINPGCAEPVKSSCIPKSVYSINRLKNTLPRKNPPELIIELNDEDSGNEDEYSSTTMVKEKSNHSISNKNDSTGQLPDNVISSVTLENENRTHCVNSETVENMSLLITESKEESDPNEILTTTTVSASVSDGDINECKESHSPAVSEIMSIGNCDILSCTSIVENTPEIVAYSGGSLSDETISLETVPFTDVKSNDITTQNENLIDEAVVCPMVENETEYRPETTEPEAENLMEMTEEPSALDAKQSKISDKINENLFVLADAEANLIKIRARLLFNLNELEESIQKEEVEKQKLNNMFKKLIKFKSMIFNFEDKIKSQKSRLLINSNSVHSLFKDVTIRTDTCAQLRDVCVRAGVKIMGPQYKPPETYESLIEEKRKAIDFSKNVPSNIK